MNSELFEQVKDEHQIQKGWSPTTVMRMHVDEEQSGHMEFENPLLRKRVLLSRTAVLELFKGSMDNPGNPVGITADRLREFNLLDAPELHPSTAASVEHWYSRNWNDSLGYYLWSRVKDFADKTQDYRTQNHIILQDYLEKDGKPPLHKRAGERAEPLAEPLPLPDIPLGKVLHRRSAARRVPTRHFEHDILSSILFHGTQLIRKTRNVPETKGNRSYLYSFGSAFDIYLAVYGIDGMEPGIYLYDVEDHALELIKPGECRDEMSASMYGIKWPLTAGCTLLYVAEYERYQWRYRHERALRNLFIDAGRAVHYAILCATAYGKLTSHTPAVKDGLATKLLGLDPTREQVLYTLTLA
ncbi:SagB/ThcOx family dehydrogenase [Heyndrickxia sporothermodurans]|uniref:SagB/ThcOx family dehydrogenase n=1 Tax=Heyndrickxia sporothermodurans TaxID=46224 RepID=UPI002E218D81|nr:SagB/ThcOx family dehydrogenase [Heyndrickxia sporothermodurans]MED3696810.1 SagB/ThcOx family dehydrogenase [Heyndrickxia sporothermodurans]MED3780648.1 SagB/ThcOx family dehydrogenase [Heyndrickxia sporothermodurans]